MTAVRQLRRVLVLGLIAGLLGAVPTRAATINLIAYVTFALKDSDGNPLADGSYVAIVGSGDAVNDGMTLTQDGYIAESVHGDDVFIGWVRIGMPAYNETPGTFYTANQYTFDDTVVHNLYLRFFDTTVYPIEGGGIAWGTSPVTNVDANIAFGQATMDFIGNYQTEYTNNFYIIPEPGTGSLLFVVLALMGGTSFYLKQAGARKRRAGRRAVPWMLLWAATAAGLLLAGRTAPAQMYTPIHIGTAQAIVDEFGTNLQGDAMADPAQCDLVQVLWASNLVIYPPGYDGSPDPNNAPVARGSTWIGNLTARGLVQPGFFSVSLADGESMNNGKVFVRAFNGPTLAEASFYGDSVVKTVQYGSTPIVNIFVDISATTNPIDPRDFDSDGLHNSWEKSYGTDENDADTDGDGMIDGHEIRAATRPLDPTSLLLVREYSGEGVTIAVTNIMGDPTFLTILADTTVAWPSVPGKQYQVEFTTNYLDPSSYANISDVITAVGDTTEITITNGLVDGQGQFRVRLVE